ncbi:ImmA/IrrE family metallo-endopeptidase [Eilatimonas milleporae]|uniref:Uncharacterized protein DUF955 n=1 Tax=Eilatimonas milleporae TaxID=911205 RepID=A0A3M0CH95_9PROT|nr:ImmA/IrrE family metallo-endopeptidase [Eilatimonas milleporae]RMB08187.1 uncharacterized protein DUF955 [Eilatimonas milleporae]
MISIDRMELEDAGGNPVKLAQAVLDQLSDVNCPIPVREIATALDIYEIMEQPKTGFEGALIAPEDKSEGAIIVRADRSEERKRYTIGHELGHYLNPWHKSVSPDGFKCTAKNLAMEKIDRNDRYIRMEVEANVFSAELLMPRKHIKQYLQSHKGADLEHIMELAEFFCVSKEAMARRYVEQNANEPAAIIFSKGNKIRYIKRHTDFPWLNVGNGSLIPQGSLSFRSQDLIGHFSSWEEINADIWVDAKPNQAIFEQTVAQSNGYRLTLLTSETEAYHDDDDDEFDVEDSWALKFARGR